MAFKNQDSFTKHHAFKMKTRKYTNVRKLSILKQWVKGEVTREISKYLQIDETQYNTNLRMY
jgi:hypothetical protein